MAMVSLLNQGAKSIKKSKGIIKYITNKWTVQVDTLITNLDREEVAQVFTHY